MMSEENIINTEYSMHRLGIPQVSYRGKVLGADMFGYALLSQDNDVEAWNETIVYTPSTSRYGTLIINHTKDGASVVCGDFEGSFEDFRKFLLKQDTSDDDDDAVFVFSGLVAFARARMLGNGGTGV